MSILDIAILGSIFLTALIAFSVGFVKLVLGLVGWVGATLIALYGFEHLQPITRNWMSSQLLADFSAGGILFLGSLVILNLLSHAIGQRIRNSSLSALDRTLGLFAGVGIIGIVLSIIHIGVFWSLGLNSSTKTKPDWLKGSKIVPLIGWGADQVPLILPENLRQKLPFQNSEKSLNNVYEKLVTPETQDLKEDNRSGYTDTERREMDRLIKGQR
jgi:membrane protein required for colicin V production